MIRLIIILLLIVSCSTNEKKKEHLETLYPDCFVDEDLEITCPDPFVNVNRTIDYFENKQRKENGKRN